MSYSDKAVSRWESGDVTPDIETLSKLAVIFAVPLTALLDENLDLEKTEKNEKQKRINKLIIGLLGITFIWIMATIIYIYSMLFNGKYYWQIYMFAFPASFFLAALFTNIWGKRKHTYILASALVWTTLLSLFIQFLSYTIWPLFLLGAPLQIAIVLWSKLHS